MSLWGVESKDDCRREIDRLLAMVDSALECVRAKSMTARHAVEELKSRLTELLHKKYNYSSEGQMHPVERAYFWPAIAEAYVAAPNLSTPATWDVALEDVRMNLRYRRPPEGNHE
jgi:ElaB/YqjD/DUF883 family membrane-anchored ribosome-binding protein